MQFELTEALIDAILFSMEDQKDEFYLDCREGTVVGKQDGGRELEEPGRFVRLPKWDSSEGFHLMERFAATFKNPVVREKLTAALDRGRGVFRAFKDVLTEHSEAERRWFAFKNREMRRVIFGWYNALREEWGLERIGEEPEETEDLVLEDFRFRRGTEADRVSAEELHGLCLGECAEAAGKRGPAAVPLAAHVRQPAGSWAFPGTMAVIAETGAGDFAGYVTAVREGEILRIAALEVKPEYRGLGIGEALLTRLLEGLEKHGAAQVLLDLGVEAEGFSRALLRMAFTPYATRYALDLKNAAESGDAAKSARLT
jgi:ribosomal protein S18 acetylase RimI-like enzyme